jgi:hypothetical protein
MYSQVRFPHKKLCFKSFAKIFYKVGCMALWMTPLGQQHFILFSPRFQSRIQKGLNQCVRVLGGVVWWKSRGRKSHVRDPHNKIMNCIEVIIQGLKTLLKWFPRCQWHPWNHLLFLPLKGESSKNISMANIPILDKYLKQKKVGGCLDLNFRFQQCQRHHTGPEFGDFRSDYLGKYIVICKTGLAY